MNLGANQQLPDEKSSEKQLETDLKQSCSRFHARLTLVDDLLGSDGWGQVDRLHEDAGSVRSRDHGKPGLWRHGETWRQTMEEETVSATTSGFISIVWWRNWIELWHELQISDESVLRFYSLLYKRTFFQFRSENISFLLLLFFFKHICSYCGT